MGASRRSAWVIAAGIGLILCVPAWADEVAGMAAQEANLLVAAHSTVAPVSQTEESLNAAPAAIPDQDSTKAPAIASALAENDVFIMVTGGQGAGLAVSETILTALADAEAMAGADMAAGPWIADNAMAGADVSGTEAMPASIPGSDRHGGAASDGLARLTAALSDAVYASEDAPDSAPENAADTAPMALAAHGEAINASEIE